MALHQELGVLAGHAHGAVIVDHVVPAVVRAQAVDRGEIDARLALRVGDVGEVDGRFGGNIHGLLSFGLVRHSSVAPDALIIAVHFGISALM